MNLQQEIDVFKAGFDAGFSKATSFINNPFNGCPNSEAYDVWQDGYIVGDKRRQILTDKYSREEQS